MVARQSIQDICTKIMEEVQAAYPGLSLLFIQHTKGKLPEAIALSEHEIVNHPAGRAAHAILKKHGQGYHSQFLGLAIKEDNKFFGLKKKNHLLGICTVNVDNYKNEDEAKADIYHMVWHAIDLYEIRLQPRYRKKFKSGPMVPKRSPLNLSKSHLQADAFSCFYSAFKGDGNFIPLIGKKRAKDSLLAISHHKSENFPGVLAMQATQIKLSEVLETPPSQADALAEARRLSIEVGLAFDETTIRQWWDFTIPSQDMAWRGSNKEEILGAAMNTSLDPYVRSVGYLVQEMTGIKTTQADDLIGQYNSFKDPDENLNLHREMIDTVFEGAIAKGVKNGSHAALLEAADKQNEDLTEGRILGWCANALQNAAKAFEAALESGTSPAQAARMNFSTQEKDLSWDKLKELGDDIIDKKRQGFAVTMGSIAEICHDNPVFSPVLNSIQVTMNSPDYIQKLEAANDLNHVPSAPEPATPAPKAAPQAPVPQAPAMAPSLGGGSNHVHRQRVMAHQEAQKKAQVDKNAAKNKSDGTDEISQV